MRCQMDATDEEMDAALAVLTDAERGALRFVTVWSNRLTRVPPVVLDLTHLTRLLLNDNPLRRLPPELGRLTRLKKLFVERCQLHELPASIFSSLTRLTALFVNGNNLKTLPPLTAVSCLAAVSITQLFPTADSPQRHLDVGQSAAVVAGQGLWRRGLFRERREGRTQQGAALSPGRRGPFSVRPAARRAGLFVRESPCDRRSSEDAAESSGGVDDARVRVVLATGGTVGSGVSAFVAAKAKSQDTEPEQEASSEEGEEARLGHQGICHGHLTTRQRK